MEQINAAGGVGGKQIELVVYDDGGDQVKAVQLANRLIYEDKVEVSFGPTVTPTGEMITPVFEQNGVLMIGFIAQEYVWRGTSYIFMSLPSDGINAEAMVLHAKRHANAANIAVAYANVPYGVNGNKFIRQMAEKHGVNVVTEEKWGETDIDFTAQANRLKGEGPDAILIWGSCAVADAQFIKALREAGENAPIVGNLCIPEPPHRRDRRRGRRGRRGVQRRGLCQPGCGDSGIPERVQREVRELSDSVRRHQL